MCNKYANIFHIQEPVRIGCSEQIHGGMEVCVLYMCMRSVYWYVCVPTYPADSKLLAERGFGEEEHKALADTRTLPLAQTGTPRWHKIYKQTNTFITEGGNIFIPLQAHAEVYSILHFAIILDSGQKCLI